jgi:hypothetical protein
MSSLGFEFVSDDAVRQNAGGVPDEVLSKSQGLGSGDRRDSAITAMAFTS